MSQALEIEIGDQFFKPGNGTTMGSTPNRTYTVYRIGNAWSIWCRVDPPLTGGKSTTLLEQPTLLRMQRIPKESNANDEVHQEVKPPGGPELQSTPAPTV